MNYKIEEHPEQGSAHEQFLRRNIQRLHKRKKRMHANDAEVIEHLEAMVAKHGQAVLEPYERRLLTRLVAA